MRNEKVISFFLFFRSRSDFYDQILKKNYPIEINFIHGDNQSNLSIICGQPIKIKHDSSQSIISNHPLVTLQCNQYRIVNHTL